MQKAVRRVSTSSKKAWWRTPRVFGHCPCGPDVQSAVMVNTSGKRRIFRAQQIQTGESLAWVGIVNTTRGAF